MTRQQTIKNSNISLSFCALFSAKMDMSSPPKIHGRFGKIGQVVQDQRLIWHNWMEGKASPIIEDRITQLNSIGFAWRANEPTAAIDMLVHAWVSCSYSLPKGI